MRRRGPRVEIGWFRSLVGVVLGAAFGAMLAVGAVALLFWTEGRTNLSDLARDARVAPPDRAEPALDGELVSATGATASDERVGDPQFVHPQGLLQLTRAVEMYAWIERQQTRNGRREYDYVREWTARPADSGRFHDPAGHRNPAMRVGEGRWTVSAARVARYAFRAREATLPRGTEVPLTAEMLLPEAPYGARLDAGYLYIGEHGVASPDVGDLRLSYLGVRPGALSTLFGDQQGATIVPHALGHGSFYRLLAGARHDAIHALALEHRILTWLLRLAGFAMLYLGLNLAAAPLSAMFDLIPPLARASRAFAAAVLLPVALGVATATIVLSRVAHSRVATAVLVVAVVFAAFVRARRRRRGR